MVARAFFASDRRGNMAQDRYLDMYGCSSWCINRDLCNLCISVPNDIIIDAEPAQKEADTLDNLMIMVIQITQTVVTVTTN